MTNKDNDIPEAMWERAEKIAMETLGIILPEKKPEIMCINSGFGGELFAEIPSMIVSEEAGRKIEEIISSEIQYSEGYGISKGIVHALNLGDYSSRTFVKYSRYLLEGSKLAEKNKSINLLIKKTNESFSEELKKYNSDLLEITGIANRLIDEKESIERETRRVDSLLSKWKKCVKLSNGDVAIAKNFFLVNHSEACFETVIAVAGQQT